MYVCTYRYTHTHTHTHIHTHIHTHTHMQHTQVGKFVEEAGKSLGAPVTISGFLRVKCGDDQ